MKISVKVKPNSKQESVEKVGENSFVLRIKAPAREGKANKAVIKLFSEYFGIPKRAVSILKGVQSRNKIIEILI